MRLPDRIAEHGRPDVRDMTTLNLMNRFSTHRTQTEPGQPMKSGPGGFTLVELLVATVILVLILVMTVQITNYASNLMSHTQAKVDSFQEARVAFELMTRKVSQAMLNTYWDYSDTTGNPRTNANASTFVPATYMRQSELQFVSGQATTSATQSTGLLNGISSLRANPLTFPTHAIFFQAPLGYSSTTSSSATLTNLLNTCGYFIEFSNDSTDRPNFLASSGTTIIPLRYRFRLKELSVPTETAGTSGVYNYTAGLISNPPNFPPDWIINPMNAALKRPIADNVIALIVLPMRSPNDPAPSSSGTASYIQLAPHYAYDSRAWVTTTPANPVVTNADSSPLVGITRNQLPPLVQVTMVAIDEPSAARLASQSGTAMPTFTDSTYLAAGLSSIFQTVSTSGTAPDTYLSDLANLEHSLANKHITYRVFSTNISILQAKWSN